MKRGLILLTDGFEDVEAIATIDVLRRSKFTVDIVSLKEEKRIISQNKIEYIADYLFEDINSDEYDFLIIPGGQAVSKYLSSDSRVDHLIKSFYQVDKLLAAICAAPSLLGKNGVLSGKKYTCFPGFENVDFKGEYLHLKGVVAENNVITATSMYYSIDFALAIIKYFNLDTQLALNSLKGE